MPHQTKSIKIDDLLLNPENPRFNPVTNQQEALDVMLKAMKMKIKNLTEDIINNGINPGKLLLVSFDEQKSKYIVLDGNRRLTAIKLINNPSIVKFDNKTKEFFQSLKSKAQSLPKKLNCMVFSSKEEARHWIKLEHTGENKGAGQVSWNAEQTARFDSDNKKRPYIKVINFMQKNSVFLEKGHATNIERLVVTSYVKEKIGLDFDNGSLTLKKDKQVVLANLKSIVNEIKKPSFAVGDIYTADQRKKWINKVLKPPKPPKRVLTKRKGEIIKETSLNTNRDFLIPKDFSIQIEQDKVNLIYHELRKLKVDDYRNAVAVLFRVFLELSIKNFIEQKKLTQKQKLYENIKTVGEYIKTHNILNEDELSPVVKATSKANKYSIFSTHTFNDYVHNLDYTPTSIDLKITWNNFQKFIEKLWE